MADWLNIAGGAGQGYVQGDQDNQRRAEFNFMQDQRARQIKQQKLDDALAAQLGKVRPAGDYTDYTPTNPIEAQPDFVGAPSATKEVKTKVTAADADRQRADIMARGGRLQDLQAAAQLRQGAYATEQAESAAQAQKDRDVLRTAAQLNAVGNSVGAARILAQHSNEHPLLDGHQVVIEMGADGTPTMAVARGGQYVQPPQPVNQQSVAAMIQQGTDTLTPELSQGARKLNIEGRTASAAEAHAQAAVQTAQAAAEKAYYDTKGRGGDDASAKSRSEAAYYDAHAWYMRNHAPGGAGGGDTYGTPIPMLDDQGQMTYGIPTKKGKDGPGITPITLPAGWTFPKPQPVMNDQQKVAYTKMLDMEKDGAFDGDGGRAKRDKFISTNGLDKFVQADAVKQKLLAADPSKQGDKAAPAAAAPAAAAPAAGASTPEAAAEKKVSDADKALSKFGSKQKRDNPAGFTAAVKARTAAQAELDALNEKYAKTQPTGAAFTPARP